MAELRETDLTKKSIRLPLSSRSFLPNLSIYPDLQLSRTKENRNRETEEWKLHRCICEEKIKKIRAKDKKKYC